MGVRTFVLVPVYNERETLQKVLALVESLGSAVQQVIIVDDGSTDGSAPIMDAWAVAHKDFIVLRHPVNKGYSAALMTGFNHLIEGMHANEVSPDDVVATVDADGQHDPLELPRLLDIMNKERLDVLWAQRDFTLYPFIKRLGNRMMSLMSRVFSGHPFRDVESGYCIFRLGPLAHALRLRSRDWRYSISLTLAVILARLGYKISNEPMVHIPLYRSRTRILDVFTDTLAAANGFLDVQRDRLKDGRNWVLLALGAPAYLAVAVMVALIASKNIYLGYDSINNYVHVWHIATSWIAGHPSLRNPWLEGGQALAYPYGFFPWTLAAVFFPMLGDYAVTWVGVLGFVLLLGVVWQTRLRDQPWLFAVFLLFPPVTEALLSFQVAFVWAVLFGFLYVRALETRSRWAPAWLVLAVSSHMLVLGPMLIVYDAYAWLFRPEQRKDLVRAGIISLPLLLPVAWYTVCTPSVDFYSPLFLVMTSVITFGPRLGLFGLPFLLAGRRQFFSRLPFAIGTALFFAGLYFALLIPFTSFSGLVDRADNVYSGYLSSHAFVPGATYRIMEASNREQGHYFLIQNGAVLGQELFSESQLRRTWTLPSYRCVLNSKGIDYVIINRWDGDAFGVHEEGLLRNMVDLTLAKPQYTDPSGRFAVYDVRPAREMARMSVQECAER